MCLVCTILATQRLILMAFSYWMVFMYLLWLYISRLIYNFVFLYNKYNSWNTKSSVLENNAFTPWKSCLVMFNLYMILFDFIFVINLNKVGRYVFIRDVNNKFCNHNIIYMSVIRHVVEEFHTYPWNRDCFFSVNIIIEIKLG